MQVWKIVLQGMMYACHPCKQIYSKLLNLKISIFEVKKIIFSDTIREYGSTLL